MKTDHIRALTYHRKSRPRALSLVRFLLLAWLALCASSAFAASPITLDITIKGIKSAQPPMLVGDVLVLSFKSQEPARFVGARFAHEGYAILHPYARNENGVFVLDYELPEGIREIAYRVVVDGLWMSDPSNPVQRTDELGNSLSLFILDKEPPRPIINPKEEPDGAFSFVFRGPAGKRVSVAGDFNGWDPFVDYLSEPEPGVYRISLQLRPGRHFYYFFSAGRRIIDPYNPETGTDPDGHTVSYFLLEPS